MTSLSEIQKSLDVDGIIERLIEGFIDRAFMMSS